MIMPDPTSTAATGSTHQPIRGYLEGYYGRLLSWQERGRVLQALAHHGMNTYCYAPKEDACHRLAWRTSYPDAWRRDFGRFCAEASASGISVIAGVAPGLDIDFSSFPDGEDIDRLCGKARQLRQDGAHHVALLMDDIDANFSTRSGEFTSEGRAHAALANLLAQRLGEPVVTVPRVYANEIADDSPDYLRDFLTALEREHPVLYCGRHIVATRPCTDDWQPLAGATKHRVIIWDNLYANDYCPRRLFVGPWSGRDQATDLLLNPTGMIETDLLLLDLMATFSTAVSADSSGTTQALWQQVMDRHEVPAVFACLAEFFAHPPLPGDKFQSPIVDANSKTGTDPERIIATAEQFEAIETCLWRWKTPLSREWYPHLMGLKHDLLLAAGELPEVRIHKTQSAPLAARLLGRGQTG